tara:strand:- start:996 stop:1253 length:258 start_codon:yes stop_codon:yes gene_type:complete
MKWISILIILCGLFMLWIKPSECKGKDNLGFSFFRYITGALFGTSAIAMAWFSGGWVIAPMVLFFFVALMVQNRTEKKEASDATS